MRILIAEDDHRIATALKKGLEQENYAVDNAFTGTDAYDMAVTEEYDLILLDIMLPGKDGIEITKDLRAKQNHTPILLLTAKGQTEDKVTGLDNGADDYLTKPFSFEELLARIRALLRRPKSSLSSVLSYEDLSLDTKLFTVTRGRDQIRLSGKEFAFLEYLLRNAKKILTKDQIIQHVWDYDADILPNTVEVYVKKLRAKIDLPYPQSKPLIHTLRGFGYRFGN